MTAASRPASPHVQTLVPGAATAAGPFLVPGAEFSEWPLGAGAFRAPEGVRPAGRAGLAGRDRGSRAVRLQRLDPRLQRGHALGQAADGFPYRDLVEDLQNV